MCHNLSLKLQRLLKFISSRKRLIKLKGEKSEICQTSYGLFTDEYVVEFLSPNTCENLQCYYHQTCDENKLKTAEAKCLSSKTSNEEKKDSERGKKLTRLSLAQESKKCGVPTRSSHVLQPRFIICEKESDLFVMVRMCGT